MLFPISILDKTALIVLNYLWIILPDDCAFDDDFIL